MPELPEVETVRRTLLRHLKDKMIINTEILYPRMIVHNYPIFEQTLKNVKILDIERKGKYLIFILSNHYVLLSHLRMEGKFLYFAENEDNTKHAKVIFHLENNQKMIYDDTRCFGIMGLYREEEYRNNQISYLSILGKEPFDADENYLFSKLKSKNKEIKSVLLDQQILTGLGNIYVDETLFKSKINPYRKANTITLLEAKNILINAREILAKAIEKGGSTVSSYHPENGVDGKFQNELFVYNRKGKECQICHHLVLKSTLNGRGTSYCPNCQKVVKRIGIYGKIASGKSTVLNYFQSLGYFTFSCDKYISSLYQDSLDFKKFCINLFGEQVLNDNNTLSKNYIKNTISLDDNRKRELENYLHPLVKKEIQRLINLHEEDELIFFEIPLLFEAKIDHLVDYVLGIDAREMTQIRNLSSRGSKSPLTDLKLNESNHFDKYVKKIDYIIFNDGSINDLFKKADEAIIYFKNK